MCEATAKHTIAFESGAVRHVCGMHWATLRTAAERDREEGTPAYEYGPRVDGIYRLWDWK